MKKKLVILCTMFGMLLAVVGCSNSDPGEGGITPTQTVSPIGTYTPTPLPIQDPQYVDVSADATGMLPMLSGAYESVWDMSEEQPITVLAEGEQRFEASYKLIWSAKTLYIQVIVPDTTNDVSAESATERDSIEIFLNEDGEKHPSYSVGDANYLVTRDGTPYYGVGADPANFRCVSYETENGYIVEAAVPLLTITAQAGTQIGLDVQVTDAEGGKRRMILKWADASLHTNANLYGVGTVVFE